MNKGWVKRLGKLCCGNGTFSASTSAKVERRLGKPERRVAAACMFSVVELSDAKSLTCNAAAHA